MYELAYSYDVNDGMTVTPGVFMIEDADDNALEWLLQQALASKFI